MPEMIFHIAWPDGSAEPCYSPSLVIKEYLAIGETYAVEDFMQRSRTALTIASDRVKEKYGFACSRAMGQLARLESAARRFDATTMGGVTVTSFEEQATTLPSTSQAH